MEIPEHYKKWVKDKIEDYKTKGRILRNAKEMMNLEIKDLEEQMQSINLLISLE